MTTILVFLFGIFLGYLWGNPKFRDTIMRKVKKNGGKQQ